MAEVVHLEGPRRLLALTGVQERHQFAVEQRGAKSVSHASPWRQHHHSVHGDGLVVDAQFLVDARAEQKQVLRFHVQTGHHAAKSAFKGFLSQDERARRAVVEVFHSVHQQLHRLVGVVLHVERVHHRTEKDLACLRIRQLPQELKQSDDHDVLFVQFEPLVDLGAGSEQFDAQLGQPLGHHVLPLTGHGLEHVDQFVEALKAVLQMHFGHLALHVA